MDRKSRPAALFLAGISAGFILAASAYGSELAPANRRGTNVTIDTNDLGPISLNEKTEAKEKKPVIFKDDNIALDFNDNSEPNINTRF